MRMPARAFIAKHARLHAFAFSQKLHLILRRDVRAILRIATCACIPNRKNNAALIWPIHLHSKVSARKTARHVERVNRIFDGGDFIVEPLDPGILRQRIVQMHRRRIAPRLHVKMCVRRRSTVEHQRGDVARRIPRTQLKPHVAHLRNRELAKAHRLLRVRARRRDLASLFRHCESQLCHRIFFQIQRKRRCQFPRRLDLAKPHNFLRRIFPAGDSFR